MLDYMVRKMTYPAPPIRVPSPPPRPLEEVWLEGDGHRLSAWWQAPPAGSPGAPVALMLHGNGENLETMRRVGLFEDFRALGAGVLAVDYPGYGASGGRSREPAILDSGEIAWSWLEEQAPGQPKVLVGWSLGAAVAIQVAARRGASVDGLVLMSPWDYLSSVARVHFPGLLVGGLLSERYDSVAAAGEVAAPVLVIHGAQDRIIPAKLGRALFEALPEPKRWVAVADAGHNDLLGQRVVWEELGRFLASLEAEGAAGAPGTG